MEGIRGTHAFALDADTLATRIRGYQGILMDIGTGDGHYVRHVARACPTWFAIGIDACRENLRATSRKAPDNTLFVIANALALPTELHAQATRIVINFPWGSLLTGLLTEGSSAADGLIALMRPPVTLEIRLNAGALAAAGWPGEEGVRRMREVLYQYGYAVGPPGSMDRTALRAFPSTWARRLAHGRDPRAWCLTATGGVREACSLTGSHFLLAPRAETMRSSAECVRSL